MPKVELIPAKDAVVEVREVVVREAEPAKVRLELSEHEARLIMAFAGKCAGELGAVYANLRTTVGYDRRYRQWITAAGCPSVHLGHTRPDWAKGLK